MIPGVGLRVGIDLASVDAVRASIARHGERYLERVYTARELADCAGNPERLAARFAAKEAAIKVLRPADGEPVPWHTIGVRRAASGAVELELTGEAAALAARAGIRELALSISHEGESACAVVIAIAA
jgi:holo-[acyl-carrier protein] synthase